MKLTRNRWVGSGAVAAVGCARAALVGKSGPKMSSALMPPVSQPGFPAVRGFLSARGGGAAWAFWFADAVLGWSFRVAFSAVLDSFWRLVPGAGPSLDFRASGGSVGSALAEGCGVGRRGRRRPHASISPRSNRPRFSASPIMA